MNNPKACLIVHGHVVIAGADRHVLQSCSNQLLDCGSAVQLRLNYPPSVLSIASESNCAPGSDWPANSLTFVCNARGNATSVLMNSILQPPFASQQGTNVSVANVTFTVIGAAGSSGAISVDILGMAQQNGNSTSGVAAVAASGTVRCCLNCNAGLHSDKTLLARMKTSPVS